MKSIVTLGFVCACLATACEPQTDPVRDPVGHAIEALLFPLVPPKVIKPYTACGGPAWDLSCDAIFLLPEAQAITGTGTYDCVTWCAGTHPNRISRPNFAGWVESRANASDARRAYRVPIRWTRDLAAAICAPTQSVCAVTFRWPLANSGSLHLTVGFRNDDDTGAATDGTIRTLILMQEAPGSFVQTRHDELYSLATRTYAATAAHQVVFTSVPGGPPIISLVDRTTTQLDTRYDVRF